MHIDIVEPSFKYIAKSLTWLFKIAYFFEALSIFVRLVRNVRAKRAQGELA